LKGGFSVAVEAGSGGCAAGCRLGTLSVDPAETL